MKLKTFYAAIFGACLAATVYAETRWLVYEDTGGAYQLNYPSTWQVLTKGTALVITSPGGPETRGVFGITPRAGGVTMDDAVKKEFDDPNRPADLVKSPARIGGLPAMKIVGSKKGDPNTRVVEYYVQNGSHQFYVLFQAPRAAMSQYTALFNGMIASIKFQ
jgi:hypothetical protein